MDRGLGVTGSIAFAAGTTFGGAVGVRFLLVEFGWSSCQMVATSWFTVRLKGPSRAHQRFGRNSSHTEVTAEATVRQIGNRRTHDCYTHLTRIFTAEPPVPGINGEPYYDGMEGAESGSDLAALYCRSAMYGSVLSGGLGGHIYGAGGWAGGMWSGEVEPRSRYPIWDVIGWTSADQMRHLKAFVLSEDARYQDLVPVTDQLSPNRSGKPDGLTGWAYCAATRDRTLALAYFEKECPAATFRGAAPGQSYRARWFDPRTGTWLGDAAQGAVKADPDGSIALPGFPGGAALSAEDWALKLLAAQHRP